MKYVVRMLSVVVLVTLLATPFVSFAQGDPRCAGLSEADCQIVLQAAEKMMGVTSVTIPSFEFSFELNVPDSATGEIQSMAVSGDGNGAVSVTSPDDAVVYLYLSSLYVEAQGESQSFNDVELILTPTMQYVKVKGEWYGGEETTDFSGFDTGSMDFNAVMNELGIDLTGVMNTTRGDDAQLHGQAMATFVSTIDVGQLLTALLASPAVGEALGMAGEGEGAMSPEEMQMIGALFVPMLAGTTVETEQWIGLEDGYVHDVSMDVVLNLDMSMFEMGTMTGELHFDVELDGFNAPVSVEFPTDYKPLEEMDSSLPDLGGLGAGLGGM